MRPTTADARHWDLDPEVRFLNHGSFGACPRPVREAQRRLQDRLEAEPVRFFIREMPDLLERARASVADFLHARPEQLAFVPNATTAVNSVLRSLDLRPGDRLLVSDHEYHACRNALDFVAERSGATVELLEIPFPGTTPEEVLSRLSKALERAPRLLLIDHVTSPTGLVLPLEGIVAKAREAGVPVLVDGAHAIGMVPLDLGALGATWYTSNLHKWLCTPKGAAFLWASDEAREATRPAVISHGADLPTDRSSRFHNEFDWTGTHDPSAYLVAPEAIEFLGGLRPGGWPELMRENRAKVIEGRRLICEALDLPIPVPESMIGSLAAIPLGPGAAAPPAALYVDPLQDRLYLKHGIEVPINPWPDRDHRVLRISAQAYVHEADYRALAEALWAERG